MANFDEFSFEMWEKAGIDSHISSLLHLNAQKQQGYMKMCAWKMPVSLGYYLPVNEMLQNEQILNDISDRRLAVTLTSPELTKPKKIVDYTLPELLDDIAKIPSALHPYSQIRVHHYIENIIGGNIVIDPAQNIYLEAVDGPQRNLSSGAKPPKYILKRIWNHIFRYEVRKKLLSSEMDSNIRSIFHNEVLYAIPHDGQYYLPGYYEFAYTQNGVIFFEYRDASFFSMTPYTMHGSIGMLMGDNVSGYIAE